MTGTDPVTYENGKTPQARLVPKKKCGFTLQDYARREIREKTEAYQHDFWESQTL